MTMRERMARAMFDVGAKRMHSAKTWETCEQTYRDLMLAEVDAALDALMGPTEAVVVIGCNAMPFGGPMKQGFEAMVRAIKEGK